MTPYRLRINATLRGTIWMPAVECTKEASAVFSPTHGPFEREWLGFREALIYLTNDGDFQSCAIESLSVRLERPTPRGFTTEYLEVPNCRALSDLFTDDYNMQN